MKKFFPPVLLIDVLVAKGPDLYVLLSNNESEKYSQETSLNIGPITSTSGKQLYKVTCDEFDKYNGSVKIWCRAFDVMFSVASLSQ